MDNEENEVIDLTEILSAVRQHLLELIFVTLAAALVGFTASKFLMTPKYDSSALMIVNTRQDVNANVTSDQINSATKLVSTYSIIIKSDTVLQQVIDNLGLNLTYAKLNKRVTVAAVDDTQVMKSGFRQSDLQSFFGNGAGFPQHYEEHDVGRSGWFCSGDWYYCAAGFAGQ